MKITKPIARAVEKALSEYPSLDVYEAKVTDEGHYFIVELKAKDHVYTSTYKVQKALL